MTGPSNISGTEQAQAVNVALLPCPHCGGSTTPKLKPWDGDPPMPGFYVVCDAAGWEGKPGRGCGCSGAYGETEAEAISAWNRRATPTLPQDVAALTKALTFHGRYASESNEDCQARKNSEREQAASLILSQSAKIERLNKKIAAACQWYWPEDDTSSDACSDNPREALEYHLKPGEIAAYSCGGVVYTNYYGWLPPADDADSDDDFEVDEPTEELAAAKMKAEQDRRAAREWKGR